VAIKTGSKWYSDRMQQDISLVRWGHFGQPVLLLPTAGGDAEEIERMGLLGAVWPLVEAGRIKVYSCDSIGGRALAAGWGTVAYRCWLLNRYQEAVAEEIVPAIRADCRDDSAEVIVAGASIGAFNSVALTCRFPWAFRASVAMSGSFDIERLMGFQGNGDFYFASPWLFVPGLEGSLLDLLRRRFILMAFGGGRWEAPDENWRMADVLGAKGIPNRVVEWGQEWDHDWPTWRQMLPIYLDQMTA
jgi:esterase/lipase superfamily enzyme